MGRWPMPEPGKSDCLVGQAPRPAADALVGLYVEAGPAVRRGRGRPPHRNR